MNGASPSLTLGIMVWVLNECGSTRAQPETGDGSRVHNVFDSEDGQDIEGHVELVPVVLSSKGMGKAPI